MPASRATRRDAGARKRQGNCSTWRKDRLLYTGSLALVAIKTHPTVMTSAQAKKFLDDQDIVMSRASVIGALNRWCKDGVLGYVEEQGQGGTRKIYSRLVDGEQFLSLLRCELNAVYNETSRGLKGGN